MMMAKADEGSLGTMDAFISADNECDDVFIDLDSFWRVMGEPTEPSQGSMVEDLHSTDISQEHWNSKEALSPRAKLPGYGVLSPSHNSEASDCRTGCSDGSSESAGTSVSVDDGRLEPPPQLSSADCVPVQRNSLSYAPVVDGSQTSSSYCENESDNKAPFGIETHGHSGSSCSYFANHLSHDGKPSLIYHLNNEDDLFGCSGLDTHSEKFYSMKSMGKIRDFAADMEDASVLDGDRTSQGASHPEINSCEIDLTDIPGLRAENAGLFLLSLDDPPYDPYRFGFQSLACDRNRMVNLRDEGMNLNDDLISVMPYVDVDRNHFGNHIAECGSGSSVSINSHVGVSKCNDMHALGNESNKFSLNAFPNGYSKMEDDIKIKNNTKSITSNEIFSRASGVIDDVISRKYYGGAGKLPAAGGMEWSSSYALSSISSVNYVTHIKDEKEDNFFALHGTLPSPDQPGILPSASLKAEINCQKNEYEVPKLNGAYLSNISYQGLRNNKLELCNLDDDSDLCVIEDMSAPPVRSNPTALDGKLVAAQFSTSRVPISQMVMGHSRLKANDERFIFQVAVQDLSQPKSEAFPPDGVLTVPLLKHQRIALSWMVDKETKSACCSGGILADDQGLGKTVSTIALILKERSPSSKTTVSNKEQSEMDMLNLDEDDGAIKSYHMKEPHGINSGKTCLQTKGRPAAGTLIVCPTSVLRQWSEELHNKVTSEADLSVLVYHGGNRTKDPLELAEYDVVITTYAIVSMEVPKQPVVDENDDQIGTPFKGFSSNKKRKLLETAPGKKSTCKKSKKAVDTELLESISGPLAKVGWFRVVLDEAQSIKNHRTQVARACWGLRAKRRWCLSGTPIQNAIDDLYSYFRFLRHEPYAVFRTFCEHLKAPIHRNPKDGYKKLQAVLKTIMLRRTKGTYIDGEPIIKLPPKTIELKKVDFSEEERDFYCRLEADSRAQFAEYAAAGTVKQNYVNILLMLLRLRQACDHPLLVRGFNSSSQMTSSIEMAKKLPREKQMFLLIRLETSLAICGICSDPPEDAVVTVCGHVFCNQCICEHMIGDNTQCPTKNCKIHLTMSQVFSITTLRFALSDQQSLENTPTHNFSDSENSRVSESHSLSCPQGSSKLKAALELLLSLCKPRYPALRTNSLESNEGCCGSELVNGDESWEKNGTPDINRDSHNSVEVVGEKAIVFSQWTRMLDLFETYLKNSSIQYRRLDGTMSIASRDRAVKDFNTLPQVSVMIMSLKAASLGLNMVAACHVILLDLWWNPTTEDQAIDRAHRIGQTRPVSVFRLTVKDTVEDRILALQQRKREMVASAFGEDGTGSQQTRLTVEDLNYLFRVD